MKTHDFIDAQLMNQEHPDTFDIPTVEELDALAVGDDVKVAIGGERFWTRITEINDGSFMAEVDNELECTDIHGLQLGDQISFERKHIYDIYTQ